MITVAALGARFLGEYVPQHCKPRTAYEYRRAVELFINPALGRHRISDIQRADVARFHHDLRDRPYQANRALGVLSKMMNVAEEWGVVSTIFRTFDQATASVCTEPASRI